MVATASYFSDVLCVWAYVAQIRLDTLQREFGDKVRVQYHFLPLFGDVGTHIDASWREKGGAPAYARHVQQIAARFDHVDIHPEVWTRNIPITSASCHLFFKAIQLLEQTAEIPAHPQVRFDGKSVFEETVWRCRLGFFRDLLDIGARTHQEAIAGDLDLPLDLIRMQIDSGTAHAALCADFSAKEKCHIEGSPSFTLNDGRQKLYGNVGYRILEANIQEVLCDSSEQASWC